MPILMEEPQGALDMAAKTVNFLIDSGATYSVLIFHTGSLSSKSCTVTGVNGKPPTHYFTGPLTCQFEQFLISHAFLVVTECPTPLMGRDLLSSLTVLWLGGPEQRPLYLFFLLNTNEEYSMVDGL